jgi:hypothetical protein
VSTERSTWRSKSYQSDLDQGGLADTLIADPKVEEGGGVDRLTVSGPPAVDPACVVQFFIFPWPETGIGDERGGKSKTKKANPVRSCTKAIAAVSRESAACSCNFEHSYIYI